MFDRYYCIKAENICYISRYFLHYFVSPFHRGLTHAISMDYALSRAGQYTFRNGSLYVAPFMEEMCFVFFSLPKSIEIISYGHARKYKKLSLFYLTIYIRFGTKLL